MNRHAALRSKCYYVRLSEKGTRTEDCMTENSTNRIRVEHLPSIPLLTPWHSTAPPAVEQDARNCSIPFTILQTTDQDTTCSGRKAGTKNTTFQTRHLFTSASQCELGNRDGVCILSTYTIGVPLFCSHYTAGKQRTFKR